jgi:uncharacterized protein YkwD
MKLIVLKISLLTILGAIFVAGMNPVLASPLINFAKGYILLQVEDRGEAWYVRPETEQRHYMKDGATAYQMMRFFGLGITDEDLATIPSVSDADAMRMSTSICENNPTAKRLSGKILLQVQQHGEAWYVYPLTCRRIYMQDGDAAYQIMRFLGLGITNANLSGIVVGPDVIVDTVVGEEEEVLLPVEIVESPNGTFAAIESKTYDLVNEHRVGLGRKQLVWSNAIADIARVHSERMAQGIVEPGHDGFSDRTAEIGISFPNRTSTSENVAWTNYSDPAQSAFNWWLTSPGHKDNLEHEVHITTGVGAALSEDGTYYFTQMFINSD